MLLQIGSKKSKAKSESVSKKTGSYMDQTTDLFDVAYAKTWSHVRPMFAHVYVENRCHLACEHCYENEETHPAVAGLSLADYKKVFEQLAELGVLIITFSGGEPFLRKDFLDIVEEARRQRFAVRVYTSGTPITAAKADRMKALGVSEVHISVYSADAEVHDKFTGTKGSHRKSVAALDMLHERGIHTVLKAAVMTFNVDGLDDLMQLARDTGADYAIDPTVKPKMNGDLSPLRFAVPPEVLAEKVYKRPEFEKALSMENAERLCNGENLRRSQDGLCAAARGLVTIWADGQVAPCAMFPVAGGSVKDATVKDIWERSPLFDKVRKQTWGGMSGCSSCDVRQGCSPCMAYALVEHDDHTQCNSFSKQAATSTKIVAEQLVRVQKKFERGVALPLLGDIDVDLQEESTGRLFTEVG